MNLKRATLLLICGLIYVVVNKAIGWIIPSIAEFSVLSQALSILWIISTLSVIVYIYYFLKEINCIVMMIRLPLILVAIFSAAIIILNIRFDFIHTQGLAARVAYSTIAMLNTLFVLVFLLAFQRNLAYGRLNLPVRMMLWAFSLGLLPGILRFASNLYMIIAEKELLLPSFLHPLAIMIFTFMYFSMLFFLIRFFKLDNYAIILKKPDQ